MVHSSVSTRPRLRITGFCLFVCLDIQPGTYVTLHILNVPQALGEWIKPERPFVVSGLFKYEHKTSVINFAVQRVPTFTDPVKSKDELIIQCGFRRYRSRPIFSQNNLNTDKFKFERFLQPGRNCVASIYGPVMYAASGLRTTSGFLTFYWFQGASSSCANVQRDG